MRIFLHIGGAKTGTSTIQECLLQNKPRLAELGYSYLHMDGRNEYRDLPAYCMNQERFDKYFKINFVTNSEQRRIFDENFLSRFDHKMHSLPINTHTVIISSEHLSARLRKPEEIVRLKELLFNYSSHVEICYYIREQAAKVTSAYSTKIKSGGTLSFDEYFLEAESRRDIDYNHVLEKWEAVFGQENIHLRIFDRREFRGGDLLKDFLYQLHGDDIDGLNTELNTQNTSLSATGITLARWVNEHIPMFNPNKGVSKLNRTLIELISKYIKGQPVRLTDKQRQNVVKRYEVSNELVRQRYFPERKRLFNQ